MHVWIITRRRFGWSEDEIETLAVVQGYSAARQYLVEQGRALGCHERVLERGIKGGKINYLRVEREEFEESSCGETCLGCPLDEYRSVGVEVTATRWEVKT